jgi:hypothetical protein
MKALLQTLTESTSKLTTVDQTVQTVQEQSFGRLIQQDHGPTCVAAAQKLEAAEKDDADVSTKRSHDEGAASLNANQVLMMNSRLQIIQACAAQVN